MERYPSGYGPDGDSYDIQGYNAAGDFRETKRALTSPCNREDSDGIDWDDVENDGPQTQGLPPIDGEGARKRVLMNPTTK
jgi:hypothetical protein